MKAATSMSSLGSKHSRKLAADCSSGRAEPRTDAEPPSSSEAVSEVEEGDWPKEPLPPPSARASTRFSRYRSLTSTLVSWSRACSTPRTSRHASSARTMRNTSPRERIEARGGAAAAGSPPKPSSRAASSTRNASLPGSARTQGSAEPRTACSSGECCAVTENCSWLYSTGSSSAALSPAVDLVYTRTFGRSARCCAGADVTAARYYCTGTSVANYYQVLV
mmetsp:Transcript_7487/g.19223  ORF Transcript_7487/g.19223 Transcript_7487/m.19223 type:complete len:221 (-) Transcript_7487:24-686(-)